MSGDCIDRTLTVREKFSLKTLHASDQRCIARSVHGKYVASRPSALEIKGSTIYAEGPIFDADTAAWYEENSVITATGFRAALDQIEGDVTIRLNSPGGMVPEASVIHTEITDRAAKNSVHVIVTGMCASAATHFLLGATTTSIAPLGMVMIHNSWGMTIGDYRDHNRQGELLEKIDSVYAQMIADLMGEKIDAVRKMMDDETWFNADEAVEQNLIASKFIETTPEQKRGGATRQTLSALTQQMQQSSI